MFADRIEAGRRLATRLEHLRGDDVVVVGLPRGGVPVAAQVAESLGAPLDVIVVRKLGVPSQPELGMGAIGEDGIRVINDDVVAMAKADEDDIALVEAHERVELERRAARFRQGRDRIPLADRTVVVVDDGIATGSTARAACQVARAEGATRVVLAVPVAPPDWTSRLASAADELVCVETPEPFYAIGQFYGDFGQTSDDEVVRWLDRSLATGPPSHPVSGPRDDEVVIAVDGVHLGGRLVVPTDPIGLVIFAHGSGSSRHSPRNAKVADQLVDAGIATLLFDLLTPSEAREHANVFDIDTLTRRLVEVTAWARATDRLRGLPVGYFGASTGAGAALVAAARPGADVAAVVSRGGRPDLAGTALGAVHAPTLLVVGGTDQAVLELNERAREHLTCPSELVVIPAASHLFEEPGTLAAAGDAARDWFLRYMNPRGMDRQS